MVIKKTLRFFRWHFIELWKYTDSLLFFQYKRLHSHTTLSFLIDYISFLLIGLT